MHKKNKAMIYSHDVHTDFFDIGVKDLNRATLIQFLFIFCFDYVLRS